MVARVEIVHVQIALIQKRAATAHFRMGIGNVLTLFVRRSEGWTQTAVDRSSPQRGHSCLRILHHKQGSWDAQTKRASVGQGRTVTYTFYYTVDT